MTNVTIIGSGTMALGFAAPLDILITGGGEAAIQAVADFAAAAGINPVLVGPQRRAQQLKQAGFLHVLLSANDPRQPAPHPT